MDTNADLSAFPDLTPETMEQVRRLSRDLRNAAKIMGRDEARFFVDAYYAMQKDRIRAAHQARTLAEGGEPSELMGWLAGQREQLEKQVAGALNAYSMANPAGAWARSIPGIGPIITAGLLAHIDITRAPTAGHVWRYAGLDPTVKWEKGQKRPWNGELKRLCFLIGESFVKVSGRPNDIYGQVYKARKAEEIAKNEAGAFSDQAKLSLESKRFGADTEARKHYEAGRLPPARIHRRAARYAVKLFLSHFHHVLHETEMKCAPPKPYILSHGNHAHFIAPPNWPMAEAA